MAVRRVTASAAQWLGCRVTAQWRGCRRLRIHTQGGAGSRLPAVGLAQRLLLALQLVEEPGKPAILGTCACVDG